MYTALLPSTRTNVPSLYLSPRCGFNISWLLQLNTTHKKRNVTQTVDFIFSLNYFHIAAEKLKTSLAYIDFLTMSAVYRQRPNRIYTLIDDPKKNFHCRKVFLTMLEMSLSSAQARKSRNAWRDSHKENTWAGYIKSSKQPMKFKIIVWILIAQNINVPDY